jgi:hypothetical protein
MSAVPLSNRTFQVRRDQVSAQVSCDQDPKFWFRVESTDERDKITDFFLGTFDAALGGDLLSICYSKIARIPNRHIVFGDFLPSGPTDPSVIEQTKARLEGYTKTLLAAYGRTVQVSQVLRRREKCDLVIDA